MSEGRHARLLHRLPSEKREMVRAEDLLRRIWEAWHGRPDEVSKENKRKGLQKRSKSKQARAQDSQDSKAGRERRRGMRARGGS